MLTLTGLAGYGRHAPRHPDTRDLRRPFSRDGDAAPFHAGFALAGTGEDDSKPLQAARLKVVRRGTRGSGRGLNHTARRPTNRREPTSIYWLLCRRGV